MKKKLLLVCSLVGAAMLSQAQTKIGGAMGPANKDAYLQLGDATGANKGLLMPRVILSSTTAASPLSAHVMGMYVYNTASAGTGSTAVSPGLYYNDGTKWVAVTSSQTSTLGNNAPTGAAAPGTIYTDTLTYLNNDWAAQNPNTDFGQQYTYNGSTWVSYSAPASTEWRLKGGSDAAGDKKSIIYRDADITVNGITVGAGNGANISNAVLGNIALASNTSGYQNTAIGLKSLNANKTGNYSTAIGAFSLAVNNGTGNVGLGYATLFKNVAGGGNTAVGTDALYGIDGGDNNVAVGYQAGMNQTAGANNIVVGSAIQLPNLTASNQMNIGNVIYGIGVNTATVGAGSIGIGTTTPASKLHVAGGAITAELNNGAAVPVPAGGSAGTLSLINNDLTNNNTTGIKMGSSTKLFTAIETVMNNHAAGAEAGTLTFTTINAGARGEKMRIQSDGNIGIGTITPQKKLDINGDALVNGLTVGMGSGNVNTNTALGYQSLNGNTTGFQNSAVGYNSLKSNTTGTFNTAVGYVSMQSNTTANGNTALGYATLLNNATGANNTAIGIDALFTNTTGSSNTAIGDHAGFNLNGGDKNIIIGYGADVPNNSGSNQLSIGNAIYGTAITGSVGAGNIGVGVTAPVEKLEVAGAVKIGGPYNVTATGQTTPVPAGGPGTIIFNVGHFWGWTGSAWKQLDN